MLHHHGVVLVVPGVAARLLQLLLLMLMLMLLLLLLMMVNHAAAGIDTALERTVATRGPGHPCRAIVPSCEKRRPFDCQTSSLPVCRRDCLEVLSRSFF
jgi:hypothetical protein